MSEPIGWFVRVGGQPVWDGVQTTALYIVGYEDPGEAKAAVVAVAGAPDDFVEVLPGPIIKGHGPQPVPNEVISLAGAA